MIIFFYNEKCNEKVFFVEIEKVLDIPLKTYFVILNLF